MWPSTDFWPRGNANGSRFATLFRFHLAYQPCRTMSPSKAMVLTARGPASRMCCHLGDWVKVFLLLWKAYMRCQGVNIPHKMPKPVGISIGKWLVTYYLRWLDCKAKEVDEHMLRQLGRQAVSQRDVSSVTPDR